jgi:hypothetical protein
MILVNHVYRYAEPTTVDPAHARLTLATSSPGVTAHPHFFTGKLLSSRPTAEMLTAVHRIVGSRFFTPANTVQKQIALADPVVTSGSGVLRFEGFSACCSAYIRVDILPEAYDGEVARNGTTNVDFNEPMRAALARVSDAQGLSLSVGREEFVLRSGDQAIVEKKVALPMRWIRGMLEVQSYQSDMRRRFQASGLQALRLLHGLPRTSTSKTPLWVTSGPFGLRTSTRDEGQGVRLSEALRLRVLERLAPLAQNLSVYADDAQQASAWVLEFPGARVHLVLSADVWRGFSGEGQALRALLRGPETGFAEVRSRLQWQSRIQVSDLASSTALSPESIDRALRILGVSGLAGYDLLEESYFHRELPFDLSMAEDLHPRLASARALLEEGAVQIVSKNPIEIAVASGDVVHRLRQVDGELRCSCPWFAKYQGQRGPCKHVLAAEATLAQ